MKKILIVEPVDQETLAHTIQKWKQKEFEVTYNPTIKADVIGEELAAGQYDALIVGSKDINAKAISTWASNKPEGGLCIVRAGSNTSTIDKKAATQYGIPVMNTPGANSQSTAEEILRKMFTLITEGTSTRAVEDVKNNVWKERAAYYHRSLKGKKLAIIGPGAIGSKVAAIANAMGMEVIAYSPNLMEEDAKKLGVKWAPTLHEALDNADVVSLQVPYITPESTVGYSTYKMIGEREINLLNDKAIIINISRRDIVDMDAVSKALESGKLCGFGLDTMAKEVQELKSSHPSIFAHPNTHITPSVSTACFETDRDVTFEALRRVDLYLSERKAVSVVNRDVQHASTPSIIPQPTHAERVAKTATIRPKAAQNLEKLFDETNIIVKEISVPGIAKIFLTHEKEANPENYAYSGIRVLSPMSNEAAISNAKRLSLTSSSWKNWMLNHAIQNGILDTVSAENNALLPSLLHQKDHVYGGRIIVIPEAKTYKDTGYSIETILKDPENPYFDAVSTPVYQAIGQKLNELKGKVLVTPDFGPNASTADILQEKGQTDYVLGTNEKNGGSGGKSEYSITSIISALHVLGLPDKPRDTPITLIGSAGALGSGVAKYLAKHGFTNVALCDLQYSGTEVEGLPTGWKVLPAVDGKFTDACLERSGQNSWIITTAYGDEMLHSNWQKMKSGTTWIAAQNKDVPEGEKGVEFARNLQAHGIKHVPGQILTIGGTTASRIEFCAKKEEVPFPKKAAHEVVYRTTAFLTLNALEHATKKQCTPYEGMLAYADKRHWEKKTHTQSIAEYQTGMAQSRL